MAARLALPTLTEGDLDVMAGLMDGMLRAADAGDTVAEASADAAFHGYLVDRAGNQTLRRVWSKLEPYSRTYINMALPGGDRRRMAESARSRARRTPVAGRRPGRVRHPPALQYRAGLPRGALADPAVPAPANERTR